MFCKKEKKKTTTLEHAFFFFFLLLPMIFFFLAIILNKSNFNIQKSNNNKHVKVSDVGSRMFHIHC
jgi:hypothetical protein